MTSEEKPLSFKPSAHYYRSEVRAATGDAERLEKLCRDFIREIERHKEWIRDRGMVPPKWLIMPSELSEKDWGPVCPFPMIEPASETAE